MTGFLDAILPPHANDGYRGGAAAFYGYCVLLAEQTFSATVHFLTPDGGKNSIASIIVFEGNPDQRGHDALGNRLHVVKGVLVIRGHVRLENHVAVADNYQTVQVGTFIPDTTESPGQAERIESLLLRRGLLPAEGNVGICGRCARADHISHVRSRATRNRAAAPKKAQAWPRVRRSTLVA